MAFYQCDFEWALGQVNVLKASTSKLIANDAAELSLLISENQTEDSLQYPLCRYAKARMAIHQHREQHAINILDSLITAYPEDPICDEVLMSRAKLLRSDNQYKEAASMFERVMTEFADEPYAAEAGFYAALLHEEQLGNAEKAFELYKKVLKDYPMSIHLPTITKQIRKKKKKMVN